MILLKELMVIAFLESGKFAVTSTTNIFCESAAVQMGVVLRHKWDVCCDASGRCTAIQMGWVLTRFAFLGAQGHRNLDGPALRAWYAESKAPGPRTVPRLFGEIFEIFSAFRRPLHSKVLCKGAGWFPTSLRIFDWLSTSFHNFCRSLRNDNKSSDNQICTFKS